MENKSAFNPRFLILMIVVLVVLLAGALLYSASLSKKNNSLQSNPNSADPMAMPVVQRDGVFTTFSATAQGQVTKVNEEEIEIEAEGTKKSFKLSPHIFITKSENNSFMARLLKNLIPEVDAQTTSPRAATGSARQQSPSADPMLDMPIVASAPGVPLEQKTIKDIKVGDNVTLTLSKQKEKDEWLVTSIFVSPAL